MQGIVLVADGLLASRDGLSSVALGSCHRKLMHFCTY